MKTDDLYPGELGVRGSFPRTPLLGTSETRARVEAEQLRIIDLLCDHFGIEAGPAKWPALCLALCQRHVPAFQDPAKPARLKWTSTVGGMLVVEVERKLKQAAVDGGPSAKGAKWACAKLASEPRWLRFVEGWGEGAQIDPGEALRKAYQKHKREHWTGIVRSSYLYHVETESLDAWERVVDDQLENPGTFVLRG